MTNDVKINDDVLLDMLFESGCYWGHQSCYRNPEMNKYIYGKNNGIDIIDLRKTLPKLKFALAQVEKIVENGGKVVLVGTKRFASDYVAEYAKKSGMPYVNRRWLGGTLTNFKTIKQSVKKLVYLESMIENNKFDNLTKKERLMKERNLRDLRANLGGLRDLNTLPDMIFVLDAKHENIAILEAKKLGIPIVSIVDTNTSEKGIDYGIPGNDDSMRAIKLYLELFSRSVAAGASRAAPEKKVLQAAKAPVKKEEVKSEAKKRVVTVKKEADKATVKEVSKKVVTVKKPEAAKTKKTTVAKKKDGESK